MPVAQVPRFVPPAKHRPVVLLGVAHETRVLFRVEEVVSRDTSIPRRVFRPPALQVDQLCDDLLLAGRGPARLRGVAV